MFNEVLDNVERRAMDVLMSGDAAAGTGELTAATSRAMIQTVREVRTELKSIMAEDAAVIAS